MTTFAKDLGQDRDDLSWMITKDSLGSLWHGFFGYIIHVLMQEIQLQGFVQA